MPSTPCNAAPLQNLLWLFSLQAALVAYGLLDASRHANVLMWHVSTFTWHCAQVIPMFVSMMAASGQAGTPGSAGPTTGAAANPQRGTQAGQRFAMPQFVMGPDNEVCACLTCPCL